MNQHVTPPEGEEIAPPTLLSMVLARAGEVGPEQLDSLLMFVERQESAALARVAQADFNAAFVAAQADMPIIAKKQSADTGSYAYNYAGLDAVLGVIGPILAKHHITRSWSHEWRERVLRTTCTLEHIGGGSKSATVESVIVDGRSSPEQSRGKTMTYLERYSLISVCGIAAGDDNDGAPVSDPAPAQKERVTADHDTVRPYLDRAADATIVAHLDAIYDEVRRTLKGHDFDVVCDALSKKKDAILLAGGR